MMTTLVTCLATIFSITAKVMAVTDLEFGRRFVLIPRLLTWEESVEECRKLNGTLGTIERLEIIPDLGYDWGWTLWVGLRISSPENMTWEDGSALNWTNWSGPLDLKGPNATCAAARTADPYAWVQRECADTLPALCQVVEGDCYFLMTKGASIKGFNDRSENMDRARCVDACRTARDFDCRSAEVNARYDVCQMSVQNRWTKPKYFLTNDRDWDYYHWTCVNGTYLDGIRVFPNVTDLPTVETTTTTTPLPTTTPTATRPTTTEEGEGEFVCRYVKPVSENETTEVREDVQQLQTMSETIKEQKRLKKKVSTPDPRPSATYIGSLAVAFVAIVLGVIVCLDIMSLPRHLKEVHGATCCDCKRLKKKLKLSKRREVQFTEYSEHRSRILTAGSPIVISPRVPHNFRPRKLTRDLHVERTYSGFPEDMEGSYVTRNGTSQIEAFDVSPKEDPVTKWHRMRREALQKMGKYPGSIEDSDDGSDVEGEEDNEELEDVVQSEPRRGVAQSAPRPCVIQPLPRSHLTSLSRTTQNSDVDSDKVIVTEEGHCVASHKNSARPEKQRVFYRSSVFVERNVSDMDGSDAQNGTGNDQENATRSDVRNAAGSYLQNQIGNALQMSTGSDAQNATENYLQTTSGNDQQNTTEYEMQIKTGSDLQNTARREALPGNANHVQNDSTGSSYDSFVFNNSSENIHVPYRVSGNFQRPDTVRECSQDASANGDHSHRNLASCTEITVSPYSDDEGLLDDAADSPHFESEDDVFDRGHESWKKVDTGEEKTGAIMEMDESYGEGVRNNADRKPRKSESEYHGSKRGSVELTEVEQRAHDMVTRF